jgi:small subunit ribosomal protein S1
MAIEEKSSFAALFEASPARTGRRPSVGDVLELEVVRIGEEEVYVALDAKQEGYVPLAELTGPDGKPTVVLGSRIAARVAEIERSTGAVRLSPLAKRPLAEAARVPVTDRSSSTGLVAGLSVKGKVTSVERYGVFLEFPVAGEAKPARGLVPVSELGMPRGADLRKAFPVGRELDASILSIDERRRIRLSVVAFRAAEERDTFQRYHAETQVAEGDRDARNGARGRSGFGTFADLLKKR